MPISCGETESVNFSSVVWRVPGAWAGESRAASARASAGGLVEEEESEDLGEFRRLFFPRWPGDGTRDELRHAAEAAGDVVGGFRGGVGGGGFDGDEEFVGRREVLEEHGQGAHLPQVRRQHPQDIDVEGDVRQPQRHEYQQPSGGGVAPCARTTPTRVN